MGTITLTSGVDTYVSQGASTSNYAGAAYIRARGSGTGLQDRGLVAMAGMSQIVGKTILAATLSCPIRLATIWGSTAAVGVIADAASWSVSKVTYANQPGGVGSAVVTNVPNTVGSGDTVSLDVTALVQAIAAGQADYGWSISVGGVTDRIWFYGFDSAHESWSLEIEYSDEPDVPTQLVPAGVISLAKWVCQLGDADDIAQIKVQVDPAASSTPAFDSGWVTTTAPTLDLASTAYAGLADGSTTYWRAAYKNSTGTASGFSDWFAVTRHVKPTQVEDNPSAGLVYTSTPTIEQHLSAGATGSTRWQVILLDATDASKVLYDSGADIMGSTLAHQIPHRWHNKPVIPRDGAYRLQVKCWDRPDRVGSYGDRPYLMTDETLTVDVDGSVDAPSGLVLSQPATGVPDVLLHFTSVADPDYFLAYRRTQDGSDWEKIPFQIDPDDARIAPGVFEWVDASSVPNTAQSWRVRAVVGDRQSGNSVSASLTPYVEGVWIRSQFGTVTLNEDDVDNFVQDDNRVTYPLPYAFEDVDIIMAVKGYSVDRAKFSIDNRDLGGWSQDVDAAAAILEQIRLNSRIPVQLVWATRSIPVYLRKLSVAPASTIRPDEDREHAVTFGFIQTDDVQQAGFGVGYYGAGTYY